MANLENAENISLTTGAVVEVEPKPSPFKRTALAVVAVGAIAGAAVVTSQSGAVASVTKLLTTQETEDMSDGLTTPLCYNGKVAPTLYVVGCQKCGTTSLWEDSVDHVYGLTTGDYKEHHYWHETDTRWTDGSLEGMVESYPDCDALDEPKAPSSNQIIGADFCPQMAYEDVPGNIYNAYADALGEDSVDKLNFVSILRDPVNRTLSYFYHALDEGWLDVEGCSDCCGSWWVDSSCSCEEYGYDNKYCCTEKLSFAERMATCNVTFDHWVDTQLERAVKCQTDGTQMWPDCGDSGIFGSLYVYQVMNFMEYFKPSQYSVIPFELYTNNAEVAIEAIANVSGAEYMHMEFEAEDVNTASNHGRSYDSMLTSTEKKLVEFFDPYNQMLYEYLADQGITVFGDDQTNFMHTPVTASSEAGSFPEADERK